jgi:H2-forming N5,N10-methylenetetrahydromethanopterin dehydrogenase-like enzyme
MITIPTSTANSVLAQVTSQFGDAGTLLIVVLVVGIPLFFYAVRKIIGLFPKGK